MDASRRDAARWWGALLLATAAAILAHQILFRPIVGLADNGDFSRVTDHLRLGPTGTSPDDRYFLYVFRSWQTAPSTGRRNLSSEILLAG
ncbi:MAG TPA: hypothetical protein VFL12_03785, partial [Thermoanaerobaculia bacterium]|nr:hypothetical protein [Thermoanaerobaculia bacterium]